MDNNVVFDFVPVDGIFEEDDMGMENTIPSEHHSVLVPYNEKMAAMAAASAVNKEFHTLNWHGFLDNHRRQIRKVQKQESSRRVQMYEQLKQKFTSKTDDLQSQIHMIQHEVKDMRGYGREIQKIQEKLGRNDERDVINEREFQAVHEVMQHMAKEIVEIQDTIKDKTAQKRRQTEEASSRSRSYGRDRLRSFEPSSFRAKCPYCNKELSKRYISIHVKNHCKFAY